jgi:hypothetical protein
VHTIVIGWEKQLLDIGKETPQRHKVSLCKGFEFCTTWPDKTLHIQRALPFANRLFTVETHFGTVFASLYLHTPQKEKAYAIMAKDNNLTIIQEEYYI